MPAITIGKLIAPRVHPQRWANNGMVVDYVLEGRLRAALNQAAKWHTKCLFRSPGKLIAPPAAAVASRARWRGRGHTGPLTEHLAIVMTLTLPGVGVAAEGLFGRCAVTEVGGATTNVDFYYGSTSSTASGDVPAHHSRALFLIPASPDTTYEFAFSDHGVVGGGTIGSGGVCTRLVSASIHEIKLPSHTLNGYLDPGIGVMMPIYDSHRDVAYDLATQLWKLGGATCVPLTTETDAEVVTRTSDTPANLANDSVTTLGAHPRFKLDLRNRNRRSKTTVPMVLSAFAGVAGGGVAYAQLYNAAGSFIGEVEITGATPAWHADTIQVPAVEDEYAVMVLSDGLEEAAFYAISLYELDAT